MNTKDPRLFLLQRLKIINIDIVDIAIIFAVYENKSLWYLFFEMK